MPTRCCIIVIVVLITADNEQLKLQLVFSTALDPVRAIHTLAAGEFCSLAQFRTLQHKRMLLEEACETRIENVIATIVFFLKDTLTFDVFIGLLIEPQSRPGLVFYLKYLRKMGDYESVADVFRLLPNSREEGIALAQASYSIPQVSMQLHCSNARIHSHRSPPNSYARVFVTVGRCTSGIDCTMHSIHGGE